MGIVFLIIGIAAVMTLIIISVVLKRLYYLMWLLFLAPSCIFLLLPLPIILHSSSVHYSTEIYQGGQNQIIYFNDFQENNNCIYIPNYYTYDFFYDFKLNPQEKPIYLQIENGKTFEYKEMFKPKPKQAVIDYCK